MRHTPQAQPDIPKPVLGTVRNRFVTGLKLKKNKSKKKLFFLVFSMNKHFFKSPNESRVGAGRVHILSTATSIGAFREGRPRP